MKSHFLSSIKLTFLCIVFFSGIYTVVIWGIAQFAPNNGKGEVITDQDENYYSNIGQKFTDDKYFWSRPSVVDYNAAGSAGSNKGPSNPDYLQTVQNRINTFLIHNPGVVKADIPADMVTASGSGLDPNISVKAAEVQVNRIAHIRGISEDKLHSLIIKHTDQPLLNLFGPKRINVLELNIDLNNLK